MSRKKSLLEIFRIGTETDNINTVLLSIKHRNYPRAEVIAVPRENFKLKAEYILEHYTDELVLKSCGDIMIVNVKVIDKTGGVI